MRSSTRQSNAVTYPPNFYVTRAKKSFETCYGDDPNVVTIEDLGVKVRVRLRDIDEGVYPLVLDGIPFEYFQARRLKKAS